MAAAATTITVIVVDVTSSAAEAAGIGDAFRLIVNNGEGAGQTVFHLHLHILGNMKMAEGSLGF